MSGTIVYEYFYPLHINLEDNQITKLSYDDAPSNFSTFEMKIFGAINKQDITKMNPNPLLGQ